MRITTNNVPRDLIDASQLTPAERARFDWMEWTAIDDGRDSQTFFRYRGELYSLSEMMRVEPNGDLAELGWHGYHADSMFSAVIVRLVDDGERAVIGTYYSGEDA